MVDIICLKCNNKWICRAYNHVGRQSHCPPCSNRIYWIIERFITESKILNGNKYCYDKIEPSSIVNAFSKVTLLCNTCRSVWTSVLHDHIASKAGCPDCAGMNSKGSNICANVLNKLGIKFTKETCITTIKRKKYDFEFSYNNRNYLLEFDGIQHFSFVEYFHKTEDVFGEKVTVDIEKTIAAIKAGYKIIRIDYNEIDFVESHLLKAFQSNEVAYFSNTTLYRHILSALNNNLIA